MRNVVSLEKKRIEKLEKQEGQGKENKIVGEIIEVLGELDVKRLAEIAKTKKGFQEIIIIQNEIEETVKKLKCKNNDGDGWDHDHWLVCKGMEEELNVIYEVLEYIEEK